jgi:hypothetical protein
MEVRRPIKNRALLVAHEDMVMARSSMEKRKAVKPAFAYRESSNVCRLSVR